MPMFALTDRKLVAHIIYFFSFLELSLYLVRWINYSFVQFSIILLKYLRIALSGITPLLFC